MDESSGWEGEGKHCTFVVCICLQIALVFQFIEESYASLKEDVLGFKQKGRVVLLGDFNARVGRSTDVDDVIGMFGEEICNASGKQVYLVLE